MYSRSNTSVLNHNGGTQLEIAVIESTLMLQEYDNKKKKRVRRVLTVFNVIIEDQLLHKSLVRYLPDFIDFDRKVKKYHRKSKISLPQLVEPDLRLYGTGRKASIRAFLHKLSRRRSTKPNSEKIETYLKRCALDPVIGKSSLFRDFLTKQRPEDTEFVRTPITTADDISVTKRNDDIITVPPTAASSSRPPQEKVPLAASIDSVSDIVMEDVGPEYSVPSSSLIPIDHQQQQRTSSYSSFDTYPSSHHMRQVQPSSRRESDYNEDIITKERHHVPTIQDYRFLQVLGRGCMGKVLLVQSYRSPRRLLALKAISKENVVLQREIVHTKMERDILTSIAEIRHPFLIRLHCAFQDADQLFLVLDYHRGGDVATQLARHRVFSPTRSRLYAAEILLGLQELHSLGIVYRDLKPENILLDAAGHVVLTDFGLSKQFESALALDHQRTGTFCGTAEYLAPEILKQEPYTYAIDFWSLGMILYEMLEGITPFYHEEHGEMYRRILEDDLEFTDAFDDVSQDFIAGLLWRDEHKRLGTGPNGPIVIRSHPYFSGLDWSDVYHKRIPPEYVPHLRSETDLSNFDRDFLNMTPRLTPVSNTDLLTSSIQDAFQGYSYINDSSSYGSSSHAGISLIGSRSDNDDNRCYYYYSDSDIQPDDYRRDTSLGRDEGYSAPSLSSSFSQQFN
ncbi:kinase-like protein [Lichtheimia hyalospora FSU 10163]|nr:kinase-like protein [Lichtheimia hyalospora FSU 10163]